MEFPEEMLDPLLKESEEMRKTLLNKVQKCTQIAIECMDAEQNKRPNIQKILVELGETGSTDGFIEALQVRLSRHMPNNICIFISLCTSLLTSFLR